jgi:hypothetical protein
MTETQNPETSAPEPEPVAEQASAPQGPESTPQPAQSEPAQPESAQPGPAPQPTVEELAAQLGVQTPHSPAFGVPAMPGMPLMPGEPAEPKPKRRIRGRTLFTGALVLGVLSGAGTGYAVQASRPATPLPPLAATQPKYAPVGVYQGLVPPMLPASQDDATLTDGDLTKLLLSKPAGASTADSTWTDQMISVSQDAFLCDDQTKCFVSDYTDGVVAVADTEWTTSDGFGVEIRMFRFAPGSSTGARDWVSVGGSPNDSSTITLPSTVNVSGYESTDKYGLFDDFAQAVHGDIVVSFWVTSPTKKPDPAIIDKLITDQMGRL